MPRPDPPTTMYPSSLRDYARVLRMNAEKLDQVADAMDQEEMTEIQTLNFPSGKIGLQRMLSFINAVSDAFGNQLANRSIEKTSTAAERKTAEALEALKKTKKPKDS